MTSYLLFWEQPHGGMAYYGGWNWEDWERYCKINRDWKYAHQTQCVCVCMSPNLGPVCLGHMTEFWPMRCGQKWYKLCMGLPLRNIPYDHPAALRCHGKPWGSELRLQSCKGRKVHKGSRHKCHRDAKFCTFAAVEWMTVIHTNDYYG